MLGLYFERTIEYRLRSLIWILIPITNNITLILFWAGSGNSSSSVSSYYVLMTIVGLITVSHTEYEVAEVDIKQGGLVNYLTKPISYFTIQLISEIPYRVLHGVYALLILGGFIVFIPGLVTSTLNPLYIPLIIIIFVLGYLISYSFKMAMAFSAFWFKDTMGFFELMTIAIIIFSGGIMPIPWYPRFLQTICKILPFSYFGYYPVIALQGALSFFSLMRLILIQGVWFCSLYLLQSYLWKQGMKKFSAVGQ